MGLTPQEKSDVLARLARSDVVSLRHASNQPAYGKELLAGYQRFVEVCKPTGDTMGMFSKMIKLLEEARLTINLKAPNWFYDENKYSSYTNYFERGTTGASTDMERRDGVEMEFGRYAGGQASTLKNAKTAQDRIAQYGVKTSLDFRGRVRPRYAALDFGMFKEGAAPKYGKSYLVLKDYMKHNATYIHRDSFEVKLDLMNRKAEYGDQVKTLDEVTATYFELGKILLYCEAPMLKKIYAYAAGLYGPGTEDKILLGIVYIEAHLHADIEFKRDVESVVISRTEMTNGTIPHPRSNAHWPYYKMDWDASDAKRVEKYANKFAERNKIAISFV
jgi:hypothetical protein